MDRLRDNEDLATVLQFSKNLPAPGTEKEPLSTAYRDQNLAKGVLTAVPDTFHDSATPLGLDLLGFLRTGSEADAIKTLAYLRSSDNVQATFQQARNISGVSSSWAALDLPPNVSADHTASKLGLQSTLATIDNPSINPELADCNGRTPWALPIEPYVCRCTPIVAL